MQRAILMRLAVMCVVGATGFLQAQDLSKLSDAERQQLNEWMAERAARMVSAHGMDATLSQAWGNTAYTSPEIEALRTRYRELQDEMGRVQRELQKKVLELPELQEKRQQAEQEKQTIDDLSKRIKETVEPLNGEHPAPAPKRIEVRKETNGEAKER